SRRKISSRAISGNMSTPAPGGVKAPKRRRRYGAPYPLRKRSGLPDVERSFPFIFLDFGLEPVRRGFAPRRGLVQPRRLLGRALHDHRYILARRFLFEYDDARCGGEQSVVR